MSKVTTIFSCTRCGAQFPKWNGRCLDCGGWGTLQKQVLSSSNNKDEVPTVAPATVFDFGDIKNDKLDRIKVGINEVDRVLGGGLVPGAVVLISGEPGIGKSTILAQLANAVSPGKNKNKVIYASGEESAAQVKSRFDRLHCDLVNIKFIGDTNAEKIAASIKELKPTLAIIDSIQTMHSSEVAGETGSVSQIRAATAIFMEAAKKHDIAIVLVGHITKDGQVAGPKTLEHMVDAVMQLETESAHNFRILRATKNRFGSTNEIGIFEMTGSGFKEIKDPAGVFMEERTTALSGTVISSIMEGTRPFLIEIQALVSKTIFGYPQRKASGFDLNRLQVLCAVLAKRVGVNLSQQDVILNVVGGQKINEPALDLAVCLAIESSLSGKPISKDVLVLGEIGLGGEVRSVGQLDVRLKEAFRLGFKTAVIPNVKASTSKMKLIKVQNIGEAIQATSNK